MGEPMRLNQRSKRTRRERRGGNIRVHRTEALGKDAMIRAATKAWASEWLSLRRLVFPDLDDAFHREEMGLWLDDPARQCWLKVEGEEMVGL